MLHLPLQGSEDGEGQAHIQADADQARPDPVVVTHKAVLSVDLGETVSEAVELVRVLTLHLCLDHVDGVVAHRRAEARKHTCREVDNHLSVRVLLEELLRFAEHDESDALV